MPGQHACCPGNLSKIELGLAHVSDPPNPLGKILGPLSIVIIVLGSLISIGLLVWWNKAPTSNVGYSSLLPDAISSN